MDRNKGRQCSSSVTKVHTLVAFKVCKLMSRDLENKGKLMLKGCVFKTANPSLMFWWDFGLCTLYTRWEHFSVCKVLVIFSVFLAGFRFLCNNLCLHFKKIQTPDPGYMLGAYLVGSECWNVSVFKTAMTQIYSQSVYILSYHVW